MTAKSCYLCKHWKPNRGNQRGSAELDPTERPQFPTFRSRWGTCSLVQLGLAAPMVLFVRGSEIRNAGLPVELHTVHDFSCAGWEPAGTPTPTSSSNNSTGA
jgi:hypothetical protein